MCRLSCHGCDPAKPKGFRWIIFSQTDFAVGVLLSDIMTDMTVWEGVVVTPSDKAYEEKVEEEEKESEQTTGEKMDTLDK